MQHAKSNLILILWSIWDTFATHSQSCGFYLSLRANNTQTHVCVFVFAFLRIIWVCRSKKGSAPCSLWRSWSAILLGHKGQFTWLLFYNTHFLHRKHLNNNNKKKKYLIQALDGTFLKDTFIILSQFCYWTQKMFKRFFVDAVKKKKKLQVHALKQFMGH